MKRSTRLPLLFYVVVLCAISLAGGAQEQSAEPPPPRVLSGEVLRSALRDSSKYEPLSNVIVSGAALIDVALPGNLPIFVDASIIRGGLVLPSGGEIAVSIQITNSVVEASPINRALTAGYALHAQNRVFLEEVNFAGTVFRGLVDFGGSEFLKRADFQRATFENGAGFKSVRFGDLAWFQRMQSQASIGFTSTRFEGSVAFSKATMNGADFGSALFVSNANFGSVKFNKAVTFSKARFESSARFDAAEFIETQIMDGAFMGRASFVATQFAKDVRFRSGDSNGVQFRGGASFFKTLVGGYADFSHLHIPADIFMSEASIAGGLQFAFATVDKSLQVTDSEIGGPSNFDGSVVIGPATFSGTSFASETVIRNATFKQAAVFRSSCFADSLALQNTDLGPYADFRNSRINYLDLRSVKAPTILRSRVDLRDARIRRAEFEDVIFEDNVDLSDAVFGVASLSCGKFSGNKEAQPGLLFRYVTFENSVLAARTAFYDNFALLGTKFGQVVDFTDARFPDFEDKEFDENTEAGFSLAFVDFGELRLRWRQLPDPRFWQAGDADVSFESDQGRRPTDNEPISRVLKTLEDIFRDRNLLADANSASYHRNRAELREARKSGWNGDRLARELEWWFWGVTCGYGTKIWWIVGWALLLDLLFALIYWGFANIERTPVPEHSDREFGFRLRLLDFPRHFTGAGSGARGVPKGLSELNNALRVSTAILLKVGYRDTRVTGRVAGIGVNHIVVLEWLLGFLVLAAFTVTLSRTQPLINQLVTGVL